MYDDEIRLLSRDERRYLAARAEAMTALFATICPATV
jgi:hypothetical protein